METNEKSENDYIEIFLVRRLASPQEPKIAGDVVDEVSLMDKLLKMDAGDNAEKISAKIREATETTYNNQFIGVRIRLDYLLARYLYQILGERVEAYQKQSMESNDEITAPFNNAEIRSLNWIRIGIYRELALKRQLH